MDVKSRRKTERMRKKTQSIDYSIRKQYVAECPFCGGRVITAVSNQNIRFFNCGCGAKVSFPEYDPDVAIELWNERSEKADIKESR